MAHHILRAAGVGLAIATAVVGIAAAQQSVDGPFVLHEWFDAEAAATRGTTAAAAAADPGGPLVGPGQPPALSMEASPREPIYAREGPLTEEPIPAPHGPLNPFGGQNRLDDRTDRVGSLTYYAAFDPSVIPFKRVVAQNRVVRSADGEYAVEVDGGRKRRLEVGGDALPGEDAFWGSFLLSTVADQWTPIASVSPEQRVLRVDAEPAVDVRLYRDQAGNHFVRTPHDGLLRLNVKLTAPKFYFSGTFPEAVRWSDYDRLTPPPLPLEAREAAGRVLELLGISRRQSPAQVLTWLVGYYRDFDAKPFPEGLEGGDLYESITREKIGVCRHRSLSFLITAQALGVPTRYVNNEAHAFVEVFFPDHGWRRIDLGGAADELNAAANQNKRTHDVGRDPLPQPQRYLDEQQRMERNGWEDDSGGAPAGGEAEAQDRSSADPASPGDETAREDAGKGGLNERNAAGKPGAGGEESRGGAQLAEERAGDPSAIEEASGQAMQELQDEPMELNAFERPPAQEAPKLATRLQITAETDAVRRGAPMWLRGRLVDASGQGLAEREVGVFLGAVGATDAVGARQLASTRTDSRGEFTARIEMPGDLAIGRWSVYARFDGDEEHQPATGE